MFAKVFTHQVGTNLVALANRHVGATLEQTRIGVLWFLRFFLMFLFVVLPLLAVQVWRLL